MPNQGALANLDDDATIDAIRNGTMLYQIASQYGVSKVAVYKRIKSHPDYKDAIKQQATSFVERAMSELFSDAIQNAGSDAVNIARARVDASLKYARVRNPDEFGDKLAPTSPVVVNIDLSHSGATMGATVNQPVEKLVNNQGDGD
jgi:AMMECR1 domain-containing protein